MRSKTRNIKFRFGFLGVIVCLGFFIMVVMGMSVSTGWAKAFPSKTVKIVVPFPPGAATDMVARFFAQQLEKRWGSPVSVVNISGGAALIGTSEVMLSKPDGYTVLTELAASSSFHAGSKDIPCTLEERSWLARTVSVPQVIYVHQSKPWKSLKELAESVQKDPASLTWATLGGRGSCDIVAGQFFEAAKIDVSKTVKVSFKGSAPAVNAVAGGHIDMHISSPGSCLAVVTAGKVRPLAVTSAKRAGLMPTVPTTREAGFPSVNYTVWFGFSGPPGVPKKVIQVWSETVKAITEDPASVKWLDDRLSAVSVYLPPAEFEQFVLDEAEMIKRLMAR